MRSLEAETIASGISGFTLMCRAGEGATELIRIFAKDRFNRVVILVGGGNNGGDALVVASLLKMPVIIYAVKPLAELRGEAGEATQNLPEQVQVEVRDELAEEDFRVGDLIIDGLLGIGFSGELRPQVRNFIEIANRSGQPIIALDLPSGINGDTGRADSGIAIRATQTITFGYPKRGLFYGDGPRYVGQLRLADIGLKEPDHNNDEVGAVFLESDARRLLPQARFDCHKNQRGRLLITAGSREYPGAAVLVASAALRSGAGVVRLAMPVLPKQSLPAALIIREVSAGVRGGFAPDSVTELSAWLEASTAVVAGPGWGTDPDGLRLLQKLMSFTGGLLLDADALNLLAGHPELWRRREQLVITPHLGEAHRLAQGFGIPESSDRIEFALALAERLHAVVLLKGFRTVVASPEGRWSINGSGCSDLATAGSGDVLSGIIGGLLAMQPEIPFEMATLGAWLHGAAGELGGYGLIADDLPELVCRVVNAIRHGLWVS